jgi:hypothetical protein
MRITITSVPLGHPADVPDGLYLQVKSSWDFIRMSRPTWNEDRDGLPLRTDVLGVPDPCRIRPREIAGKPDYVRLNSDRTHWLCKINLEMQWGREITKVEYFDWFNSDGTGKQAMLDWMVSAYNDFRCYTNIFGLNTHANHLTGERLDQDDPRYFHLVTGRSVLKPVMDTDTVVAKRNLPGWGDCYGFHCINASSDLWQYSPMRLSDRHLFEQPLSTGRVIAWNKGGAYIARDDLHKPFPQFNGKMITPVWMPQDTIAWIPVAHSRIVSAREIQTYNKIWVV